MITPTGLPEYLPKGIIIRNYKADTFSEAFEFKEYWKDWNPQVTKVFNGTKRVFKIKISNQN